VYVDGYVPLVVAQLARVHLVHVLPVAGVHALLDGHLPEPGDVVEDGERDGDDHVGAGPAVRAQGPGLQRVAHGHEPFQRDGQRQVHGHGLRDHGHGVDDGRDQRVHVEVVREQAAGARVDHRQPEQQDGRDDEHGVAPGQPDQQVVDGGLHLRPGQDDHRDHVAQDAERAHRVQQHAVRDELEQQIAVVRVRHRRGLVRRARPRLAVGQRPVPGPVVHVRGGRRRVVHRGRRCSYSASRRIETLSAQKTRNRIKLL